MNIVIAIKAYYQLGIVVLQLMKTKPEVALKNISKFKKAGCFQRTCECFILLVLQTHVCLHHVTKF